jgi:hypothetical protein|tara:strand:- start:209 stop:1168 length:960 start_codon:yes stop_codon:yes gene_type:complete
MLEEIFKKLETPTEKKEDIYKTQLILGKYHRLGKNYNGLPSILINTKKNNESVAPYKGMSIRLRFNINCKIHEENEKQNYTILSCISKDEQIIKIFLDICQTTISQLGKEPTPKEISEKTQMLIDLFKEMPNKLSSIVGLWGELFLIASSRNIPKSLEAWHQHAEDKYDFYDNNEALEVKCTSKTDRKHTFKHDQLVSNLKDHYVASIMISDDPIKGLSVVDLYEDIKKRCKLDNLNNKLKKIFFKIVGKTPYEELNEYRYNFDYSKKNVMYYKLKDISTLVNEDDSVTDISYKVDLSRKKNVDELSKDKFTSYLHFPS